MITFFTHLSLSAFYIASFGSHVMSAPLPPAIRVVADSDTVEVRPPDLNPLFQAPSSVLVPDGAEFPLREVNGCAAADVTVNGKGPFQFVIESGSGTSYISPALANNAGHSGDSGTIDTIGVGGIRLYNLPMEFMMVMETPGVDGVLGLNSYHDLLLTLDYPNHRARVTKGALPPVNGKDIFALERIPGHHLFRFQIAVAGKPTWAVLDTQNSLELWVAPSLADSILFEKPPVTAGSSYTPNVGVSEQKIGRLKGEAVIGGIVFQRPLVSISPMKPGYETMWNVGCKALREFAVTIDERHHRVRFARASRAPVAASPE